MKSTKNITRQPLGSILGIVGSMCVAMFALEPFALAGVDPSWVPTGSLNIPRSGHTATLLPNGKVLVVGGGDGNSPPNYLNSSELYDPVTGAWTVTGNLSTSRSLHTATLLANGKVLVVGGISNTTPPDFGITTSAEVYDPATGNWSFTGSPNIARFWHTATLLQNGKVLVAGGAGTDDTAASAELYDPSTGTWSVTGSLIDDNQSHGFSLMGTGPGRYGHTATLLQNGKVLVTGGSNDGDLASTLASAELYDPSTGTWSFTGNLNASRISHTATLLPDGKVLVAAGYTQNWVPVNNGWFASSPTSLNSAELYDPATGTWSVAGNLSTRSSGPSATLLRNGKVLVVGGGQYTTDGSTPNDGSYPCGVTLTCRFRNLQTADVYDPATGSWSVTASLNAARSVTATLLPSGKVLVAGANGTSEIYDFSWQLMAAVLPNSRSVQVGIPATAFATIINTDSNMATSCAISPSTGIPVTLTYQTTDPATNQVIGAPNAPVDIPPGAAQSFVFALTPTAPMAPTDVQLSFDCANTDSAPIISGLNTFLFSASVAPVPDILALAATLNNDGIVNIRGTNGTGIFAVATVNVGAGDTLTVSADAGGAALPVNVFVCQTDPQTSVCLSPPANSVTTTILTNEAPTFGVFVAATGEVSFFPEIHRIFVRFKDSGAITRGSTSVAVRSQ